ncbi:YlxR family protein [Anthocerotibacter panamensis]|uniref:YlxR family protein n=1 Tax=Anthocerotibacter panamensis TaxID=2857077 RepID=UPI001C405B48|nr:YlxR family protein [Anthocerotibacter panamensis]
MTQAPHVAENLRICLACRRKSGRDEFWRVVRVWPSHEVQLDQGMGRSAYLCPNASCLKQAQRKDRLAKVLKARVPPEVYAALWTRLQVKGQGTSAQVDRRRTDEISTNL